MVQLRIDRPPACMRKVQGVRALEGLGLAEYRPCLLGDGGWSLQVRAGVVGGKPASHPSISPLGVNRMKLRGGGTISAH